MHLEVVTPTGSVVDVDIDEVTAPGQVGEFGVLPGNTPFLSALRPGVLRYVKSGQESRLATSKGLIEVTGNDRVVVITDRTARAEDIDAAAMRKELDEAEAAAKTGDPAAEDRRAWAQARLDLVSRKS
jgi:F-type H+-transporting ATPase subunit epsilon